MDYNELIAQGLAAIDIERVAPTSDSPEEKSYQDYNTYRKASLSDPGNPDHALWVNDRNIHYMDTPEMAAKLQEEYNYRVGQLDESIKYAASSSLLPTTDGGVKYVMPKLNAVGDILDELKNSGKSLYDYWFEDVDTSKLTYKEQLQYRVNADLLTMMHDGTPQEEAYKAVQEKYATEGRYASLMEDLPPLTSDMSDYTPEVVAFMDKHNLSVGDVRAMRVLNKDRSLTLADIGPITGTMEHLKQRAIDPIKSQQRWEEYHGSEEEARQIEDAVIVGIGMGTIVFPPLLVLDLALGAANVVGVRPVASAVKGELVEPTPIDRAFGALTVAFPAIGPSLRNSAAFVKGEKVEAKTVLSQIGENMKEYYGIDATRALLSGPKQKAIKSVADTEYLERVASINKGAESQEAAAMLKKLAYIKNEIATNPEKYVADELAQHINYLANKDKNVVADFSESQLSMVLKQAVEGGDERAVYNVANTINEALGNKLEAMKAVYSHSPELAHQLAVDFRTLGHDYYTPLKNITDDTAEAIRLVNQGMIPNFTAVEGELKANSIWGEVEYVVGKARAAEAASNYPLSTRVAQRVDATFTTDYYKDTTKYLGWDTPAGLLEAKEPWYILGSPDYSRNFQFMMSKDGSIVYDVAALNNEALRRGVNYVPRTLELRGEQWVAVEEGGTWINAEHHAKISDDLDIVTESAYVYEGAEVKFKNGSTGVVTYSNPNTGEVRLTLSNGLELHTAMNFDKNISSAPIKKSYGKVLEEEDKMFKDAMKALGVEVIE